MAFYDIDTEYKNLLDHGLTDEQILAESGIESNRLVVSRRPRTGEFWGAQVGNRSSQAKWESYYAARLAGLEQEAEQAAVEEAPQDDPEATTAPTTAVPSATYKQVQLIMKLISQGRHREGGYFIGPTTREDVAKMDRRSASQYIDSLLGQY